MLAVARGKDPAAEKRAERSRGTFEELAGRYVEEWAKRHNKSWRQATALVARHLIPKWGKLQATTITRSDVKAVMAIEAPVLANQVLAAASAIFSWAAKEELVERFQSSNHMGCSKRPHPVDGKPKMQLSGFMESVV